MNPLRTSPHATALALLVSTIAGCSSGSSLTDAPPSSHEAGVATPDATPPTPDAKATSRDATPSSIDGSGPTPDALATELDANTAVPDATTPPPPDSSVTTLEDARPPRFPEAGAAVEACQSCLSSTCGADVTECLDDPSCEAAINCTITSGCLAIDAGGIEACVDSCIKSQGLTPHETAELVQEITTLSTCAKPCITKCGGSDAGH